MIHRRPSLRASAVLFLAASVIFPGAVARAGLNDATVLIIRHAEKPDSGDGLTPAGEARAKAYVDYFKNFQFQSEPVKLDAIFATADSAHSRRPRITVEPLAQALGIKLNLSYKDKDYQSLVTELQTHASGKNVLVCWHHGVIPGMLRALGADPSSLLPDQQWPPDTYNWVIVLRYDHAGHLKDAQRIEEKF